MCCFIRCGKEAELGEVDEDWGLWEELTRPKYVLTGLLITFRAVLELLSSLDLGGLQRRRTTSGVPVQGLGQERLVFLAR